MASLLTFLNGCSEAVPQPATPEPSAAATASPPSSPTPSPTPSPENPPTPESEVLHIAQTQGVKMDFETFVINDSFQGGAWKAPLEQADGRDRIFFSVKSETGLIRLLNILNQSTPAERDELPPNYENTFRKAIQEGQQIIGFYDGLSPSYGGIEPSIYPTQLYLFQDAYVLLGIDETFANIPDGLRGSTAAPPNLELYILPDANLPVSYTGPKGEVILKELK